MNIECEVDEGDATARKMGEKEDSKVVDDGRKGASRGRSFCFLREYDLLRPRKGLIEV